MATAKAPRGNRYAANCAVCGNAVQAGEGLLQGSRQRGWRVIHEPARWVGSPVSGRFVGGCPEDGQPLPERQPRVNVIRTSGGTFYRNSRGRCEDAPCCGCCTI